MKNQGDVSQEHREGGTVKTEQSRFTASDIASEYTLFNHGILFGPAGLRDPDEDPLIEWFNKLGDASEHIIRQAVETPVFLGLDAPALEGRGLTWNHLFFGVRNHLWDSLRSFICGMVLANRAADHVYLVRADTVIVPDPVLRDRTSILVAPDMARVPITVFGLDGSRDQYRIAQSRNYALAAVLKRPPRRDTLALWEQIRGGDMSGLAERTTQDTAEFMRQHEEMRKTVEAEGPSRAYRRIDGAD